MNHFSSIVDYPVYTTEINWLRLSKCFVFTGSKYERDKKKQDKNILNN